MSAKWRVNRSCPARLSPARQLSSSVTSGSTGDHPNIALAGRYSRRSPGSGRPPSWIVVLVTAARAVAASVKVLVAVPVTALVGGPVGASVGGPVGASVKVPVGASVKVPVGASVVV